MRRDKKISRKGERGGTKTELYGDFPKTVPLLREAVYQSVEEIQEFF